MAKKTFSPLRYPGGKSRLFNDTSQLIINNNLQGCTYIEPFAGGSSLALELLYKGIVDKLVLNDFDPCIYAFWNSVLNNTDDLISLIKKTPISIDEWARQKKIHINHNHYSELEVGFSTLFLNRTNRSGILKAGPIGGKNQNGNNTLDCRFNKDDIIRRIELVKQHQSAINFYKYDARVFLKQIVSRQKRQCFIFFDPPYYEKGPGLYINFFTHADHLELSKYIKGINKSWILTYDNADEIRLMYEDEKITEYNLNYSAQRKYIGTELMYYSKDIIN